MPVRDRLAVLFDPATLIGDGALASAADAALPADGVVTGVGRVDGRPVAVIAYDLAPVRGGASGWMCTGSSRRSRSGRGLVEPVRRLPMSQVDVTKTAIDSGLAATVPVYTRGRSWSGI